MAFLKDTIDSSDHVLVVSTSNPGIKVYKCPGCGSAMKEDQQLGWRICSNGTCRKRVEQAAMTPEIMINARHPCPICGKETKEHHNGARICSRGDCRFVIEPPKLN